MNNEGIRAGKPDGADLRRAHEDAPEVLAGAKKKKPEKIKKETKAKAAAPNKGKTVKEDAAPKEKKAKKEKKPASAGKGALIMLLVFFVLLGGAGALVFFDVGGAKILVADALGLMAVVDEEHDARMNEWQTALQNEAEELKARTGDLQRRESDVIARENALGQKEMDLENKIAEYEELVAQLQAKNTDINDVVKMLSGMSADTAAPVLLAMSDRETMISIFKQLKPDMQSALLEAMSAEEAASVLESMR